MLSVFDLFTVGLGPSSSHTVGPMKAARQFVDGLVERGLVASVHAVRVELYGSLGLTGKGHGSDRAVLLGLQGEAPDSVDLDRIDAMVARVHERKALELPGDRTVAFDPRRDLIFHKSKSLPRHPNGMLFRASGPEGATVDERIYYSVGGGFVVPDGDDERPEATGPSVPFRFRSGDELLRLGQESGRSIGQMMMANEMVTRSEAEVVGRLAAIWDVMRGCIDRGCQADGKLPGGLGLRRRAPALLRELQEGGEGRPHDPSNALDWVNLSALAVNEENAAGGRVVTAPTNGAAGVIPAVLTYYTRFYPTAGADDVARFLLTAGAIGVLYKENASISGAEVGCQGEVGVACSMAAAGLTEVLGGTIEQVENAAEIGMEHNLGLTCDPVGGLVQVPCIERNAMGAVKAINASRLALRGDGQHRVSLDKVIATMRQTGADMKAIYKETSRGGLAVNVIEC